MRIGQGKNCVTYKLFGIVTNRDIPGDKLIWWHRKRCGHSEQVHSVMKEDLAGGRMPSGKFGVNAAWWQIMILSLNLTVAMKRLVLGTSWSKKRLKALRFGLINIAGRIVERARQISILVNADRAILEMLQKARERIAQLASGPITT